MKLLRTIKAIVLAPYYLCINLHKLYILYKLEKQYKELKEEHEILKKQNQELRNDLRFDNGSFK